MNHTFPKLMLLSGLALAPLLTIPPAAHAEAALILSVDDDSAYSTGTRALNEGRWADAIAAFDQVITAKAKKADAALYWKAYALNKLGKQSLANDTCAQLQSHFKDSTWNSDCRVLTTRFQPALSGIFQGPIVLVSPSSGPHSKDPDIDMKILALNSLLHREPAQAIPLLRGILTGDQPKEVKRQALFVLAQGNSPEAQAMLHDLVLGKMGPELQKQAIQTVGIYQGRRSDDILAEAYHTTTDPQVKQAVISALFVASDDNRLVTLARGEKDLDLKRSIVSQLSLMPGKAAQDYMMELLK